MNWMTNSPMRESSASAMHDSGTLGVLDVIFDIILDTTLGPQMQDKSPSFFSPNACLTQSRCYGGYMQLLNLF